MLKEEVILSGYIMKIPGILAALLAIAALAAPDELAAASAGLQSPGRLYKWHYGSGYNYQVRFYNPACRYSAQSSYRYTCAGRRTVSHSRFESRNNRVSYNYTQSYGSRGTAVRSTGSRRSYGYQGRYDHRQRILLYRDYRGNRGATIGSRK